ncbi:glutamine--fructose-6-phosphate transaminase (isomerizing) [Ferrimonas balearica]|uniref:glutamine--fructose-6-phosphate transaminase (isomerizing) n=1 Tax=Ferrimonas balearica TaxID=44012 RepID=UPI001C99554B|nr:glutamine--fructose-6-phosphate transaminase (isomerizing) [Ferrimonas balearica]MBY5923448.1 glutamine--fructose-6-phosphate transaminase (isomerizing) [Ferrimonas balearica]MBY5997827.1 glutamine--fructose-6-phosphate transaminase (isomerizing) [Ferrimonas balearica]
MCGIVGAVAQRDVAEILVEGLKRLEYRGYDSAGVAVLNGAGDLGRLRRLGKVQELASALDETPLAGGTGIAHTRWATHGEPSERNAHPHVSSDEIAVVHNGIIENHVDLRTMLQGLGYVFSSDTDTEVIAHLVHHERKRTDSLLAAVQATVKQLEGAYGTVVMDCRDPERLVVARSGSPLVVGYGLGEHFIASDQLALLPVTRRFAFLEEGDVAEITRREVAIYDINGEQVEREIKESEVSHDAGDKGPYRHYMMKEIYEQPTALQRTLEGRLSAGKVALDAFGDNSAELLAQVKHVQIIACGTSYHAGMVARYWLEQHAGVSCNVEIASEFRYRKSHVFPNSLLVTISQSGETADTLAALRLAKEMGYMASLTICNVPGSSLVRESDMAYMMKAGAEIGVASTKAFTVQLAALLMLTGAIGIHNGMNEETVGHLVSALQALPSKVEQALSLNDAIEALAEDFADKHHALFLGRGEQYPIAMEGALKLKEISYIHAEAYASGELKHGPLALIDADMPVIVVAPNNELLEKLKSNVEEVRARGGLMYVFADVDARFESDETMKVIPVPHCDEFIAPIIYTLPLQLLSYYVALIKGTDVDQPRNLAKSVTVE